MPGPTAKSETLWRFGLKWRCWYWLTVSKWNAKTRLPRVFAFQWYNECMLTGPQAPQFQGPDFIAVLGDLPVRVVVSPLALGVILALVGILTAVVSVVLIYHWRRFPFEHDAFRRAEFFYLAGLVVFLGVAVIGTLTAA
jgi:hypothetical protein